MSKKFRQIIYFKFHGQTTATREKQISEIITDTNEYFIHQDKHFVNAR